MLIALIGLLAIGVTGSARAATLDFTGTFELRFRDLPSWIVPAAGSAGVSVTGADHLTSLGLPSGAMGPVTLSIPWTTNPSTRTLLLTLSRNRSGSFTGLSGGPPGGGTMGLSGLVKLCLIFAPCEYAHADIPLTPTAATGLGVGGTQTVPPGAIAFTMQHAPWTIGQPLMTIHTPGSTITTPALPGGFAHGPASLTSSTAQLSGALQLVTVTKVFTTLGGLPELPLIGALNLHFVPEPGTLLLLGLGVAGLAAHGRRKLRR